MNKKNKVFYKTTIVIYSEEDPGDMELEEIGREATEGGSICESQRTITVGSDDVPAGARDFFRLDDDDIFDELD